MNSTLYDQIGGKNSFKIRKKRNETKQKRKKRKERKGNEKNWTTQGLIRGEKKLHVGEGVPAACRLSRRVMQVEEAVGRNNVIIWPVAWVKRRVPFDLGPQVCVVWTTSLKDTKREGGRGK